MQGRMENTLKKQEYAKKLFEGMPEIVSEYYYNYAASMEAESTITYLKVITSYIRYINSEHPETVTCEEMKINVGKYVISKETKIVNGEVEPTSASYQLRIHSALKNFMEYLFRAKKIDENPMVYVRRTKKKDEVKRIKLSQNDLKKILKVVDKGTGGYIAVARQQAMKSRDKLIMLLFMNTGIRETALSEINIDNIDFKEQTLSIMDKGSKTHIYEIGHLMPYINEWLEDRKKILTQDGNFKEIDALFISRERRRITSRSIEILVAKYSREALGEQISPHKLRAAFCTIMYDQTKDINFVKEAVGHANIATTQRYIVSDGEAKKEAANIMAKKLGLI